MEQANQGSLTRGPGLPIPDQYKPMQHDADAEYQLAMANDRVLRKRGFQVAPAPEPPKSNAIAEALERGHKAHLTEERLGVHEYRGYLLFQEPRFMHWKIFDKDGREPFGVALQRKTAHDIIDREYTRTDKVKVITGTINDLRRTDHSRDTEDQTED